MYYITDLYGREWQNKLWINSSIIFPKNITFFIEQLYPVNSLLPGNFCAFKPCLFGEFLSLRSFQKRQQLFIFTNVILYLINQGYCAYYQCPVKMYMSQQYFCDKLIGKPQQTQWLLGCGMFLHLMLYISTTACYCFSIIHQGKEESGLFRFSDNFCQCTLTRLFRK